MARPKKEAKPSVAPDTKEGQPKPEKAERAKPLKWEDNKEWTQHAIAHLLANVKFRLKLFSDSTTDAKEQGRRKVQNGEGKAILYGELAEAIFTADPNPEIWADYKANPTRYTRSTQQQFQQ